MMRLRDCREGFEGRIKRVTGPSTLKRRFMSLGLLPGKTFKVLRFAPLKDPLELEVMGYYLAIRKDEAAYIVIED